MDNREAFKSFVRKNPTFANFIKDGSMTWQKFYELYDMYGENSSIWNEYKEVVTKKSTTLNDIINLAKNIDLDKLNDGVNSLSKAVGLFTDLFASKDASADTYKPRAIYRRFDD
jgi:hypothetical protein